MQERNGSNIFISSILQDGKHLLDTLRLENLLYFSSFLIPTWQIQAPKRGLDNFLHQLAHLLLLLCACILDSAFCGCIANIHSFCIVWVRLDTVCSHVDDNVSSFEVLGHFYVLFCAIERFRIIRCDLRNFGENLLFTLFSNFTMFNCEAECLFILFVCVLLDYTTIIFGAVLQFNRRCLCLSSLCPLNWLLWL